MCIPQNYIRTLQSCGSNLDQFSSKIGLKETNQAQLINKKTYVIAHIIICILFNIITSLHLEIEKRNSFIAPAHPRFIKALSLSNTSHIRLWGASSTSGNGTQCGSQGFANIIEFSTVSDHVARSFVST